MGDDLRFFILSLRWTKTGDMVATWWKPDRNGYTHDLEMAGKYSKSEADCIAHALGDLVLSVPCDMAYRHARQYVHIDALSTLATESLGYEVRVHAPFVHERDDEGNELSCGYCDHEFGSPGSSKIVRVKDDRHG